MILFLLKYWKDIVGFLMAIVFVVMLATIFIKIKEVQTLKKQHNDYVIAQQLIVKEQQIKNKNIELFYQENLNQALENANEKIKIANAAANSAKSTITSLRQQTSVASSRVPSAPSKAKDEYINTCNSVLNGLAEEGARISEAADGHAIDAETLSTAWPEIP